MTTRVSSRIKRFLLLGAAVQAGVMTIAAPARAQTADGAQLETIVVTAQKREQNAQDVGISITALSGDVLQDRGIKSTEDLSGIPGVYISTFGSEATTVLTIRGVSQNDVADHNEPPNALYVDGAYNSFVGGAGFSMFDVARVEVLRGPQGTLFGRNATGGLMQIVTKKPTDKFEAYGTADFGEYAKADFEGAISGPLSDTVRARLSVATNHNNGYIRNTLGGSLEGTNNYSGRLQLEWQPTEDIDILFNLHGSIDDVKGSVGYNTPRAMFNLADPAHLVFTPTSQAQYADFCSNVFFGAVPTATSDCAGASRPIQGNAYVTTIDNPGFMRRGTHGLTVTANVNLTNDITLTAISDYLKLDRSYSEDTDGTQFKLFNFYSDMNSYQVSQEVRVQSDTDRLHWVAGLYYLKIHHNIITGIDGMPDANTYANAAPGVIFPFLTRNHNRQETDSVAAFAQVEYKFSDQFTGIIGGRVNYDRKEINIDANCTDTGFACAIIDAGNVEGTGFNSTTNPGLNKQRHGDWSGKVELDYHPAEGWLTYASVTRGQKGGGFNNAAILAYPASVVPYKAETLYNYEVGLKSTLFNNTTRFNADVFHYDYRNYQAFTLTGLSPTVFNTNALVDGFEAELTTMPFSGFELDLGTAYLDARAENVPSNLLPGAVNLGTQTMPQSPKWSVNGLARYTWSMFGGEMSAQSDFNFVGRRWFNTVNHPALQDGAYVLANARLSYIPSDERWEFALWVKNFTNVNYASFGYDLSGTNGDQARTVSPPRWFGGSISFHTD